MMEPSDRELLERYLAGRDDAAFRKLVARYLDLVHGVARRVTRNDELARDVAQTVFLRLARQAALIPASVSLAAWLHRTASSRAADLVRGEVRRKKRERLAAAVPMNDANEEENADFPWQALAPVVDQLIDALPGADREIVLARFYRNESHAAIAARLGLSEVLARKRTSRALEKLRGMLGRRGIANSASALAALLPAHVSASPAPSALMGSILHAAQGVTPLAATGLKASLLVMDATQKTLVAVSAAIFLTSLGYAVRPSGTAAFPAAALPYPGAMAAGSSLPAPGRARPAAPAPALPGTAEGRRERLTQIMAIKNLVTRRREMIAFTSLLQADQFEDLFELFVSLSSKASINWQTEGLPDQRILAAAWAKKDPERVLALLKASKLRTFIEPMAFALGATHPEQAAKWAKESPYSSRIIAGLASVDLPAAMAVAESGTEKERSEIFHYMCVDDTIHEPEMLVRVAELAKPGEARTRLLVKGMERESRIFPSLAMVKALQSDPEALRQTDVKMIFWKLSQADREGANAVLAELPEGPVRGNAASGVANALIQANQPAAAFALLDRYPEAATDAGIADLVRRGMPVTPSGELFAGLSRIRDPELRRSQQLEQLQVWKAKDSAAVQSWIDDHRTELPDGLLLELEKAPAASPQPLRPR